jgi:broad specificity phosphatase PhoE
MTTVHFIRHGEVKNPEGIYYGRLPGYGLSEEGKAEIEHVAGHLKRYPAVAIFHSPLQRAAESAAIINQYFRLPLIADERLVEIGTHFEGKTQDHLQQNPPTPEDFTESMDDIYERMTDFVEEMADRYPNDEVIAISHGGPIHILEFGLNGMPFTEWSYEHEAVPKCGSDTIVTVDGETVTVNRAIL